MWESAMFRRTVLVLAVALATAFTLPTNAAELAGKVTRVKGEASAELGGKSRKLSEGAEIFVGETLKTGKDTRLEVVMIDEAKLTLGDNSRLVVEAYLFSEAGNSGKGSLKVVSGVFRAVSGKLGKVPGAPFQVKMQTATLGIRGTEFWGEQKKGDLLVALLGGGGIWLETKGGRVEITEPGFATRITTAARPPAAPFKLSDAQVQAALATVAW
jgi:hypothetical protein